MAYLAGLHDYLDKHYGKSIYDLPTENDDKEFTFHAHNNQIFNGKIKRQETYDIEIECSDNVLKYLPKTDIKLIYHSQFQPQVQKLIKIDPHIIKKKLQPIIQAKERNYVKNKSLFPLMMAKQVLFFYLLEGEVIKGIIEEFSRYEITVHMKGQVPVTIFRHALLNITDKKKRSYMKVFQEKAQDWKKSPLFISDKGE